MEAKNIIYPHIVKLIQDAGLTQREACDRAEIPFARFRGILVGRCLATEEQNAALCRILGIPDDRRDLIPYKVVRLPKLEDTAA